MNGVAGVKAVHGSIHLSRPGTRGRQRIPEGAADRLQSRDSEARTRNKGCRAWVSSPMKSASLICG